MFPDSNKFLLNTMTLVAWFLLGVGASRYIGHRLIVKYGSVKAGEILRKITLASIVVAMIFLFVKMVITIAFK